MNLPPFPVLPSTPEERLLWLDWGERVAAAERERLLNLLKQAGGISDVCCEVGCAVSARRTE